MCVPEIVSSFTLTKSANGHPSGSQTVPIMHAPAPGKLQPCADLRPDDAEVKRN
jgi:hypothetical protein